MPQAKTIQKGAGATFPYPVYAKWLTNYRRENSNVDITYDSVGSEAGIRRLLAGDVDFGASDNPEAIHEIAPGEENKYLFFPSVIGAVVPIVNLPGVPSDIAFTPEALAGIYLGRIKKWNDPIIKQANRGVRLPDLDIVVVHRADGSGTTYAWTDYLSKTSPEWKAQVGAGLAPKWPTGRAADGNDGVAKLVKELGGSIGYVEHIYALQNHLSFGTIRNRKGEFVGASLESMAVAARQSIEISHDFKVSAVNLLGPGVYPVTSFTWFVVPAHIADDVKRTAITGFLEVDARPRPEAGCRPWVSRKDHTTQNVGLICEKASASKQGSLSQAEEDEMNFQKELRNSKQFVREWVRANFSDEKLASVAAFNADGKMNFRNPCGCLMGVTSSDRLHVGNHCDRRHYWLARRQDLAQTRRFAALFPSSGIGKTERAYIFLGFSATFTNCFGDDDLRRRRFAALLRAEMRRRARFSVFAEDDPIALPLTVNS